jgi:hypothetical protein
MLMRAAANYSTAGEPLTDKERLCLVLALENYSNLRATDTRGNVHAKRAADADVELAARLREEVLAGETLREIFTRAFGG